MYDQLKKSIHAKCDMSEEEFDLLITYFKFKPIHKGALLLKEGEICRYGIFVLKGCLSYYATGDDGNDKVVDIATEGRWMADGQSFIRMTPSHFSIKALEDSEVLLITRDDSLETIIRFPKYLYYHYFALLESRDLAHQFLLESNHAIAELKYKHLVEQRPDLFQRIPLQYIASYLGITPQSLSRLRHNLSIHDENQDLLP